MEKSNEKAPVKKTGASKNKTENSNLKVKVKFLQSPSSAPFFLGYNKGDVVEIDVKQAAELIDAEFAVEEKVK